MNVATSKHDSSQALDTLNPGNLMELVQHDISFIFSRAQCYCSDRQPLAQFIRQPHFQPSPHPPSPLSPLPTSSSLSLPAQPTPALPKTSSQSPAATSAYPFRKSPPRQGTSCCPGGGPCGRRSWVPGPSGGGRCGRCSWGSSSSLLVCLFSGRKRGRLVEEAIFD